MQGKVRRQNRPVVNRQEVPVPARENMVAGCVAARWRGASACQRW